MSTALKIGVILQGNEEVGIHHTYFSQVLEGFRRELEKRDISILFLSNNREGTDSKTYLNQLQIHGCDACMICCADQTPEIFDVLSSGIPVVAIDMEYENAINVSSDNVKGMADLTEYVISMGHKNIALIMGNENPVTTARLKTFLDVCEKHNIQISDDHIIRSSYRDINMAYYHTENLLKSNNPPSIIMYCDDFASIGGINVINARGLRIPKDISITGFDGNDVLSQYEPIITTIKQDCIGIGSLAAQKIIEQLDNPSTMLNGKYYVDVTLEKGNTVKKVYI